MPGIFGVLLVMFRRFFYCFCSLLLFQGQCANYLPHKEEFIVYGLLMIEVEAEDLRNGFCRRHLKITNTKVSNKKIAKFSVPA